MSTRQIGQLNPVGVLDNAALIEIEQTGVSFKATIAQFASRGKGNLVVFSIQLV